MKYGWNAQGYTILEVMIFLAVSAALLTSALLLINGQQQRTEFNQSVREIQSQVEDIINNVASGYYSRPGDFTCTASATGATFAAGGGTIGTNDQCMFIGRAIHFGLNGSNGVDYNVYNLVGNRLTGPAGSQHITDNIADAQPTVLDGTTEHKTLQYQLKAKKMFFDDSVRGHHDISTVAFFTSLGETDSTTGDTISGAQTLNARPVFAAGMAPGPPASPPDQTEAEVVAQINADNASNLLILPSGGITICFESEATNQHANLLIGGNGRNGSTDLDIGGGLC